MKINLKRTLSLLLVFCLCMGIMPTVALAAETSSDTVTNVEGGITTTTTTTTTTETGADGKTTVTITIQKDTSGTTESGESVERKETETTTTVTEENGAVTEQTISEGSEKKEWTEEVQPGQEVLSVNVTIQYETNEDGTVKLDENGNPIPKKNDNGEIIISGSVDGDPVTKTESDTTTTTTTDREVDGTIKIEEKFEIISDESKLECPRGPEEYQDKGYTTHTNNDYVDHTWEGLLHSNGKDYFEDKHFNDGTPAVGEKPTEEGYEKGYDLVWSGEGDKTWGVSAVFVEDVVYLTNEDGEIVYENGFPVVDMEKSKFVRGQNSKAYGDSNYCKDSGMVSSIGQFALKHENGEYFYAYCMDASTGASPEYNKWYNIRNMEDAIESETNPDGYLTKEEAGMIRTIASNGYWGNESGAGSLDSLKKLLMDTYDEDDVINVRYPGSNDPSSRNIYELIEDLTEAEALAVTQAAIWTYANNEDVTYTNNQGEVLVTGASVMGVLSASKYHNGTDEKPGSWLNEYKPAMDVDSDARMRALYLCLLNLDPIYADGELREDSTVIPNEGVVSDVALVIKDKVADDAANLDNNTDNDVYNTDLNFKLAFIPGEKDDMYVILMDAENQPILDADNQPIKKLLASEDSAKSGDDVIKPVDGVYTLTGLKLGENSEFEFDLRLEGTQYLEEGVYIYQAEGGRNESQTLVGLAEGEQKVNVSSKVSITFNVDESNHVVAKREWGSYTENQYPPAENDPPMTDIPDEEPPLTDIPDEEPPLTDIPDDETPLTEIPDDETPLTEIPDEEPPLANVPKTGDGSAVWFVLAALLAVALSAVIVIEKKRQTV